MLLLLLLDNSTLVVGAVEAGARRHRLGLVVGLCILLFYQILSSQKQEKQGGKKEHKFLNIREDSKPKQLGRCRLGPCTSSTISTRTSRTWTAVVAVVVVVVAEVDGVAVGCESRRLRQRMTTRIARATRMMTNWCLLQSHADACC